MSDKRPEMIDANGDVIARISCKEMTWFSFLQSSRAMSSSLGGWNSKTHWVKSGLERLIKDSKSAPFLADWTAQSLDSNALPRPRTGDFRLDDRVAKLLKAKRGAADTPDETTENFLNWRLSQSIFGDCSDRGVNDRRVVTFELPLASEANGQLKADVVVFDHTGMVEIIELKRSGIDGAADTPLMALTEGICYALQVVRCWSDLRRCLSEVSEGEWPELNGIHTISIVLAAPDYWTACKPGKEGDPSSAISRSEAEGLRAIVSAVEQELRRHPESDTISLKLTLAEIRDKEAGRLSVFSIKGFENTPVPGSIVTG